MKIYRNIINYKLYIVPLLQCLTNIEYLTLLLAINGTTSLFYTYMSHLHQFNFHIFSILENPIHLGIDMLGQRFLKYQQ